MSEWSGPRRRPAYLIPSFACVSNLYKFDVVENSYHVTRLHRSAPNCIRDAANFLLRLRDHVPKAEGVFATTQKMPLTLQIPNNSKKLYIRNRTIIPPIEFFCRNLLYFPFWISFAGIHVTLSI